MLKQGTASTAGVWTSSEARKLPFTSVGFVYSAALATFFDSFAPLLKQKYGSHVHLYLPSEENAQSARDKNKTENFWDSIENCNVLLNSINEQDLDFTAETKRGRAFEQFIGETINRLNVSHRQFGYGYSFGSFKHPRPPYVHGATYVQLLHAYNECLGFWDREIKQKKLTLILDGDKIAAVMARAHGIAYRTFMYARYANRCTWGVDEFQSIGRLKETFDSLTQWEPVTLNDSYDAVKVKNKMASRHYRWGPLAREIGYGLLHLAYCRIRGYQAGKKSTFTSRVTYPIRRRSEYRKVKRLFTTRLEDLTGVDFAYFPLHKEPERSITQASPEHFNQHHAIVSLSRDLPAGALLAVKENFRAIGRRSDDFYENILKLKNVVLLDLDAPPIETIRHAKVTCVINGTAGLEASMLGKPVIAFGRRVWNEFLPHVSIVADEAQLVGYIDQLFNGVFESEVAVRDGARFQEALCRCTYDAENYVALGNAAVSQLVAERALENLIFTFEDAGSYDVLSDENVG